MKIQFLFKAASHQTDIQTVQTTGERRLWRGKAVVMSYSRIIMKTSKL